MAELMSLCLFAEAGSEQGGRQAGVGSPVSFFFLFCFLFLMAGGALELSGGLPQRPSSLPCTGKQNAAFSLRSTVTWEAAVNVGHVSGLLLLVKKKKKNEKQNIRVLLVAHGAGKTIHRLCLFAQTCTDVCHSFKV